MFVFLLLAFKKRASSKETERRANIIYFIYFHLTTKNPFRFPDISVSFFLFLLNTNLSALKKYYYLKVKRREEKIPHALINN